MRSDILFPAIFIVGMVIIGVVITLQSQTLLSEKVNESIETCNACFTAYNVNEQCNLTWKPCGKTNESICMEIPEACIHFGEEYCHESCPYIVTLSDTWVRNRLVV